MKLHFISGLPRSGSTLLAALLRQNPRFHAAMSSPVANIMMRVLHATSRGSEGSVFIGNESRKRILRGILANYYVGQAEVIFDTNRVWCAKMPLLAELYKDSKVICCVRDVAWIINSIEKLLQGNPLELSGIFNYNANTNVFGRAEGLSSGDGMVGFSINALREAYYGPFADKLLLVEYEALAREPKVVLKIIYDFIGEEPIEHDIENVYYEADEFDESLGTPGLHTIKGPVKWHDQRPILPPILMQQFSNMAFWRDQDKNIRGVKVLMYEDPQPSNLRVA